MKAIQAKLIGAVASLIMIIMLFIYSFPVSSRVIIAAREEHAELLPETIKMINKEKGVETEPDDIENGPAAVTKYVNDTKIKEKGDIVKSKSTNALWKELIKNNNKIKDHVNSAELLNKILNAHFATQFLDTREDPSQPINWSKINSEVTSKDTQGIVKLKRILEDDEEEKKNEEQEDDESDEEEDNEADKGIFMTYVNPKEFQELIDAYNDAESDDEREEAKEEALKHFTLKKVLDNSSESSGTNLTSLDNFLFIGDSRYASDVFTKKLEAIAKNIKNVGQGSATIEEWLNVAKNGGKGTVQDVEKDITGSYSGISIQLGANSAYNNVDGACKEMEELIEELKKLHPGTPIFVNSCLGVNSNASSGYSWNVDTMKKSLDDFNSKVSEYCNQTSDVYYIDISANLMESDGYVKLEYEEDGLHLSTEEAFDIFVENIKNGVLSTNIAGTDGNAPTIEAGTAIELPSGLGDIHTYMGWQTIESVTSNQYKLREQAGMNFDSEGFGKINGRYVIACTETFGKVGDYVDFYQTDGTIIKGIIGEIKDPRDNGCTQWGHNNGHCVVEFVVNKDTWYYPEHANPGTSTCHPEWNCNISKAVNGGSYFDNPNFGSSSITATKTISGSNSQTGSSSEQGVSGQDIVKEAEKYVGKLNYVWRGASLKTGVDCSGFVGQILAKFGLVSQKDADNHAFSDVSFRTMGTEVKDLKEAQAGDIVCYDGHVAIFDGKGGVISAKDKESGVGRNDKADYRQILTIRRFASKAGSNGGAQAILQACEDVIDMFMPRNIIYSVNAGDLIYGDIDRCINESKYACCATYVSCVLYKAGALTADQINPYNYHATWEGCVPTMLEEAGWTQVSLDEIQPGDVVNVYGIHVLIYGGDDTYYDQGTCVTGSSAATGTAKTGFSSYIQTHSGDTVQVWRGNGAAYGSGSKYKYVAQVATWTITTNTLSVDPDDPEVEEYSETTYRMSSQTVDYRKYISKYDMPFNYMWAMLLVGEDMNFVSDLANLVYRSRFVVTIKDNIVETTSTDVEKYTKRSADVVQEERTGRLLLGYDIVTRKVIKPGKLIEYTKTKTTNVVKDTLDIKLTLADAWCARYTPKKGAKGKTSKKYGPNFVTLFNKHVSARRNILSTISWKYDKEKEKDWIADDLLFSILESNNDTKDMVDITKYMLYKATSINFGITEFNFNVYDPKYFLTAGGGGVLSVTETTISREEFIQKVQSYAPALAKSNTQTFRDGAAVIYDVCVKNHINPVLCVAQAWQEGNWGPIRGTSYNFWGIGAYNSTNTAFEYSAMENAVQKYCDQINNQMNGNLKDFYQERAAEYAPYNSKFKGDMSTIYDVFSAYCAADENDDHKQLNANFVAEYIDDIISNANSIFGGGL